MVIFKLSELGLGEREHGLLDRALGAPKGLIIFASADGHGKVNTAYAALHHARAASKCVIAPQNEHDDLPAGGIFIQVGGSGRMTKPDALKSDAAKRCGALYVEGFDDFMELDAGLRAAASGHLVLGTVSTPDAMIMLTRFVDMRSPESGKGFDLSLVASSVSLIMAQRLLRRPCRACALPAGPGAAEGAKFRKGPGCAECGGTGYKGRTGAYEGIAITEPMRALLAAGADRTALQAQAVSDGMRPLREQALLKLREGLTTIEEIEVLG